MRRLALAAVALLSLGNVSVNEPPLRVALIAHRTAPLPRNAHLFVRERWLTVLPPTTSFTLHKKGSSDEFPISVRVQPLEDGRLHEIVPAVDLDAHATYELTLQASLTTQTFTINVGDTIDRSPPEWDGTLGGARDDSALSPIYLVWRAGSDGLVDVDALPSDVMMSIANLGSDGYVAVQVIDFAGHRLEPREIVLGGAVENATTRRLRLTMKRAAARLRENPMPVAIGFASIVLVVYVIAKRKRHFA